MEYIKDNPEIVHDLVNILINNDSMNTITHILEILALICNYWKKEGADIVYNSLQEYATSADTKIFKEFVQFIDDNNAKTKICAIEIICLMFKYITEKDKVKFNIS